MITVIVEVVVLLLLTTTTAQYSLSCPAIVGAPHGQFGRSSTHGLAGTVHTNPDPSPAQPRFNSPPSNNVTLMSITTAITKQ